MFIDRSIVSTWRSSDKLVSVSEPGGSYGISFVGYRVGQVYILTLARLAGVVFIT